LGALTCCQTARPPSLGRDNPEMGFSSVLLEIHINRRKDHPVTVRRNHRLADALKRHHVFKGKRPFGGIYRSLSRGKGSPCPNKCDKDRAPPLKRFHSSSQIKKGDR